MSREYTLETEAGRFEVDTPVFNTAPPRPKNYRPKIGVIGCGGIVKQHLAAYRADGWDVAALCDLDESRADAYRREFYPHAAIFTDYRRLLDCPDIDVADIALHPAPRADAIEAALKAGKHVLSQKPFALDLDRARELVELAAARGCRLAVNQNGRWAPYVRYIQCAVDAGVLGEIQTVNMVLNWNHNWVKGKAFERLHHLILYDFAIHWIDMTMQFFAGRDAQAAHAVIRPTRSQQIRPPLLANLSLVFENGLAGLAFNADSTVQNREWISVSGSKGNITVSGSVCNCTELTLETAAGIARPRMTGAWFPDGFRGTMNELLCAIEENREPSHSGRNNLRTLEVAFAAIQSADQDRIFVPGAVRRLGPSCEIAAER